MPAECKGGWCRWASRSTIARMQNVSQRPRKDAQEMGRLPRRGLLCVEGSKHTPEHHHQPRHHCDFSMRVRFTFQVCGLQLGDETSYVKLAVSGWYLVKGSCDLHHCILRLLCCHQVLVPVEVLRFVLFLGQVAPKDIDTDAGIHSPCGVAPQCGDEEHVSWAHNAGQRRLHRLSHLRKARRITSCDVPCFGAAPLEVQVAGLGGGEEQDPLHPGYLAQDVIHDVKVAPHHDVLRCDSQSTGVHTTSVGKGVCQEVRHGEVVGDLGERLPDVRRFGVHLLPHTPQVVVLLRSCRLLEGRPGEGGGGVRGAGAERWDNARRSRRGREGGRRGGDRSLVDGVGQELTHGHHLEGVVPRDEGQPRGG
eukprot:Sspe_Gene.25630::Locus_10335_Transcript_1_1_Confidence_1.000_Length_1379::g.25630::m.25630